MSSELYHHGILGQKWGKRNGPPYPLSAGKHSASEKKAGWEKSLDNKNAEPYNKSTSSDGFSLSDKQKKALKTGAIIAGSVLAAYGAYKLGQSGAFDSIINLGKASADSIIVKGDDSLPIDSSEAMIAFREKVNPTGSRENCYNVAAAATMQLCGIDVSAKGNTRGSDGMSFGEICDAFGAKPTSKHPTSIDKVLSSMARQYKEGDTGALAFHWNDKRWLFQNEAVPEVRTGHTVNWVVKNGKVELCDFHTGRRGTLLSEYIDAFFEKPDGIQYAKFGNRFTGLDNPNDDLLDTMVNRPKP